MRTFLRRVSYLAFANAVNGVLGIVFVPVAVHRLGSEGYGLYSIYTVLLAYTVLVELGLGKNLVRVLAGLRDEGERREQLRLALGLYISVSALLVVAAPLIAWAVPRFVFPVGAAAARLVHLITLLSIADYVLGVPVALFRNNCIADERFDRYSRFVLASGVLRYGICFAAVLVFTNPAYVVAAIVARRLGDAMLARPLMGALPKGAWRPRVERREFARMIGHSSALSAAQLMQITVVSVGAMLVNYWFGLRSLGVYRAVFDLTSKVWFFSNVVGFVVFPRFVRLMADPPGRERLGKLMPSVLQASWLGFGGLAVAAVVVGPWVLARMGLGGEEYAWLFVTMIVGVSFNAHTNLACEFLQAMGRYRTVAGLAGLSLTILLLAFFALSNPAGVVAIGWAWLVSQIVYAAVADTTVFRVMRATRPLGGREVVARVAAVAGVLLFVHGGMQGGWEAWLLGTVVGSVAVVLNVADLRRIRAQYMPS